MFLSCKPSVFVVGKNYLILISTYDNGLSYIEIGGKKYYEDNSGVLSTEKNYNRIVVPQSVLDRQQKYTIVFRKATDRKAYFSVIEKGEQETFSFKPLKKSDDIHIYHVADVHYHFAVAEKTCSYFGDDLDLLIVNGDIGEVETKQNYFEVAQFLGNVSKGQVPIVFTRGNHDTRGKLAELFDSYFVSDNKKTYYTYEVGCISGVVFDCGEDKYDDYVYGGKYEGMKAYDGYNIFSDYRKRQSEYYKNLKPISGKYKIAIGHICPNQAVMQGIGDIDFERENYTTWSENFARVGIQLMLCGHWHRAYLLKPNDERSIIPNLYPIIVGSACNFEGETEEFWGTAITLSNGKAICRFTNQNREIKEEFIVPLS